ncbi:MAG: DNA-binding protein, partial [Candidatus Altiarchaeales archaeon HGW-Altiarchaeales-2]
MEENQIVLSADNIKSRIWTIRDMQVMPDIDLAELYKVETRILNQAVKRNIERFPPDFMFQLTKDEFENL